MCDVAQLMIPVVLGLSVLYGPVGLEGPSARPGPYPVPEPSTEFGWGPFADVLGAHTEALPVLAAWRRTFADHAEALARLVTSLPGAQRLAEAAVRARIRSRWGLPDGGELHHAVFAPWTNTWSGTWSDGTLQFHVWDRARGWQGQWVQLVAQSEVALPAADRIGALVERDRVDLALNVVSGRAGITGWVSKRQHGRVEIPCLGYLLEPALLLWLCHASDVGAPRFTGGTWMAYLEGVDTAASPPVYHIQGQPFEVHATVTWDPAARVHHHGRYVAHTRPASALRPPSAPLP